jgi:hypothetical protein
MGRGGIFVVLGVLAGSATTGCEEADLTLPRDDDIESAYTYHGALSASMSGNVAEVEIVQADRDLRRGGTLWAKVGPYVLLFSEETRDLFRDFPGLAGVRVITTNASGTEVARALLPRDALNDLTWRRALNVAGRARKNGTRRPTLLEDLVRWGEDHTEYEYNPRFGSP